MTMDGDIGIFKRSGWGKHGGEFGPIPRWHAGAVGEKALCSVNRTLGQQLEFGRSSENCEKCLLFSLFNFKATINL